MDTHPIPQDVTSFQFKLVGDMTLKQFLYLAAGSGIAYLLFVFLAHDYPLATWPLIIISALLGVAFAFLPIGSRPLDHWLAAFLKAIYSPTKRIWKKNNSTFNQYPLFPSRLVMYLSGLQPQPAASMPPAMPLTQAAPVTSVAPLPQKPEIPLLPTKEELQKTVDLARQAQNLQMKIIQTERTLSQIKSDEGFKDLFEGFDQNEQDSLYERLNEQYRNGQELKPAEKTALERLETARRIQKHLTEGRSPSELREEDRDLYKEAKSAVDLAFELYGVMGEKAKRGGGMFLVDRNIHIYTYNKYKNAEKSILTADQIKSFRLGRILTELRIEGKELTKLSSEDQEFYRVVKDKGDCFDYIPIHWTEKFVHFAENWTKAEYGHLPAAFLEKKVAQARKMALWALKRDGFDAKLFDFTLYEKGEPEKLENIIIGYNKKREPITLARLKPSDLDQYRQPRSVNIPGYKQTDQSTTLFDVDGNPVDVRFEGNKFVCLRRKIVDPETFLGLDQLCLWEF